MTKNSIDYITKKHFRSFSSFLVTLITAAIAALSAYLSVMNGLNAAFAVFAGFAILSVLFSVISLFSPGTGCTLMRITISVNAFACFFAGMGTFTLGYLFIRHGGSQDRINDLLREFGYGTIATAPKTTGALLFAASVILYLASGCAFFGHRYLGAARSCCEGTLKRNGFRVFPLLSFLLFAAVGCAVAVFFLLSGQSFIDQITAGLYPMLVLLLLALLLLHLLFSGICARSLARKTFAFKVFEKQIMKVETNADGTVYVPINEDKEPDAEEPLTPSKKKDVSSEKRSGKQYIKDFAPSSPGNSEYVEYAEGDIL